MPAPTTIEIDLAVSALSKPLTKAQESCVFDLKESNPHSQRGMAWGHDALMLVSRTERWLKEAGFSI